MQERDHHHHDHHAHHCHYPLSSPPHLPPPTSTSSPSPLLGFNCPSLQPSILQCAQTENDSQFDLENCFKRLDHFLPCAMGERRETIPRPDEIKGAAI